MTYETERTFVLGETTSCLSRSFYMIQHRDADARSATKNEDANWTKIVSILRPARRTHAARGARARAPTQRAPQRCRATHSTTHAHHASTAMHEPREHREPTTTPHSTQTHGVGQSATPNTKPPGLGRCGEDRKKAGVGGGKAGGRLKTGLERLSLSPLGTEANASRLSPHPDPPAPRLAQDSNPIKPIRYLGPSGRAPRTLA